MPWVWPYRGHGPGANSGRSGIIDAVTNAVNGRPRRRRGSTAAGWLNVRGTVEG